jgi:hypothetical protein
VSVIDLGGQVIATLATDDEPCDVVFAGAPQRASWLLAGERGIVFDPADRRFRRCSSRRRRGPARAAQPAGTRSTRRSSVRQPPTILASGGVAENDFRPTWSVPRAVPAGGQDPPNSGAGFQAADRGACPPAFG